MGEEEKNLTKQLFTVNFNCQEHYQKIKDTFGVTLKEYLRGHEYKSVGVFANDQDHTITVTYNETLEEDDIFQMDTTPCPVPIAYVRYETTKILAGAAPVNDAAPPPPSKSSCFNCGKEDHSLKDCREPRDGKRISKARQSMSKKMERYHLNVDQKYDAYKPGVIGKELKEALGIRSRELPIHIYKMRQYGYPPGWLEEAKVTDSGLSMFTHHKSSEGTKDDEEESAIYDPQLIIDFPGFNTCRGDFIDDSRRFDLPRMHPMHEKEFFISRLKRKSDKQKKPDVDVIEIDMDQSPTSPRSPTLDDLRNEQKKLLEELNIAGTEKVGIDQQKQEEDTETEPDTLPEDFVVIDEVLDSSQTSQISNGNCSLTTRSNALSVHHGTPILKVSIF